MDGGRSKFLPLFRRGEPIQVEVGTTIHVGVRDLDYSAPAQESFFVNHVLAQQLRVIAKVP